MPPAISVCIPCYNYPEGIVRALESLKIQSFTDYECIISDDSLGDAVRQAISPFLEDKRIVYLHNHKAFGTPANWNHAVCQASGDYIKMLHHDDWLATPETLSILYMHAMQHQDCGFIACACNNISPSNLVRSHIATKQQLKTISNDFRMLLEGNFIGAPSVTMIHRNLFELFDANLKWLVDIDQYISVLKNTKLYYIDECLINITENASFQTTRKCEFSFDINIQEYSYIANKIYGENIPLHAIKHISCVLCGCIHKSIACFIVSLRFRKLLYLYFVWSFCKFSLLRSISFAKRLWGKYAH